MSSLTWWDEVTVAHPWWVGKVRAKSSWWKYPEKYVSIAVYVRRDAQMHAGLWPFDRCLSVCEAEDFLHPLFVCLILHLVQLYINAKYGCHRQEDFCHNEAPIKTAWIKCVSDIIIRNGRALPKLVVLSVEGLTNLCIWREGLATGDKRDRSRCWTSRLSLLAMVDFRIHNNEVLVMWHTQLSTLQLQSTSVDVSSPLIQSKALTDMPIPRQRVRKRAV